ncbi:ATP/GTP-binding protein [Kitasatospora sp. NPDC051853]|uniref:ATP/GTP-binding protein n=1 Tax=Kitasatospora sp. NPDC051853 TaxID=3364058 RepID=UPI0037913F8F
MAGQDLRALFGSNDRSIAAAEAFTNRQAQWRAVGSALAAHLRHVTGPAFDVEDLEAPRDNVLVFHGVGGIGKTTLSRKIEASLTGDAGRPEQWPPLAGLPEVPLLPVRIDLARSAGTDFERIVLTLRLALAGAVGRPLPAFDIALRRYWEHTHPGEPLEDYLQRAGLAAKFGKALPQQMQSALGEVAQALLLPGMVGTAVGQLTGALVGALRERRQQVKALAGCARLADLLEAEPTIDALSYYPHLLAWELQRLPAHKQVVPVVLLDTFEDTGDRTHRELERLIQRLVWLMPNALFVVTGRNRLQWAESGLAGQLDFTGPTAWPGLAEPPALPGARQPDDEAAQHGNERAAGGGAVYRQVLIGDFSPEDADDYLARRLTQDGRPLIGDDLRQVIAARSHGLPLYLDLAAARFLDLRRGNRTVTAADVDYDFPALIARTLQDLTGDERHVLRAVSLLAAFDLDLATRTAGLTHQAAAQRLAERAFVQRDDFAIWPLHLHALIRTTLRRADDHSDDRWSLADWRAAAARALEALGDQWAGSPAGGRRLLVACLRQGLVLSRDFDLPLGWLTDAAWVYVDDSVWEPVTPAASDRPSPIGAAGGQADTAAGPNRPAGTGTALVTAADALTELLAALARRQHEHRSRTITRLAAVATSGLLPEDLEDLAIYYRAKAERDLGQHAASRTGMQQVAERGGRRAPAARRGLAHLARLAGDFPAAHAAAQGLGWKGREQRVLGDIYWPHAHLTRAADHYLAARTEAEQHAVAGERATSQAQRAYVLAFTDPAVADDEIDLATHLLTGLTLTATTFTVATARLLRDAGTGVFERPALQLRADTGNAGIAASRAAVELAFAFHHAVDGDQPGHADALARLARITADGHHQHYLDIAHFMAGQDPFIATDTRWLDPEAQVRARWHHLVQARRDHLTATGR